MDKQSFTEAYILCREVLAQLGEDVPETFQPHKVNAMVKITSSMAKTRESDLLEMNEMDERTCYSIRFYNIMAIIAFTAKPKMYPFIACRMVQITMQNGLCRYSLICLSIYAMVLCSDKLVYNDIEGALQMGKAAISVLKKRYHTSQTLANLNLCYHGYIAFYTEPLQTCAEMLQQGFVAGLSLGEVGDGFLNSSLHIRAALLAGERLPSLLDKLDYYLTMATNYQNEAAKAYLSIQRNTILILIGKGESFSSTCHGVEGSMDEAGPNVLESIYFQVAIQTFWQGYSDRCQFFINKFLAQLIDRITSDMCRHNYLSFIEGINSFQLLKIQSRKRLRSATKKIIRLFKTASSRSKWNFQNKVRHALGFYWTRFFFIAATWCNAEDTLRCFTYPCSFTS